MTQKLNAVNAWNQLYVDSEQLTQATSIHEVFTQEDINFIESRLKYILHTFLTKGELNKGIKIYVDRQLQNNVVDQMALQKPTKETSLEDWCTSIFDDKKFGVIFNSLESYDNQLVERMCSIIHPLLEKAGMPLGGLSFLFFMGNYGFTPFGIHKEAKGEEGFLFHMGPSNKTFYTWDIEEYNAIEHNTEVFHNVEEMLPMAKPYELSPTSVMFIPNHLYHIANTEEFSFSVVMDYINPSREAMENLMAEKIATEIKDAPKHKDYFAPMDWNGDIDWKVLLNNASWEEKYKHTLQRYITRLQSNHGILLPAIPEVGNYFSNEDFSIKGKSLFPLLTYEDLHGQLYVMVRGKEIPVKKNAHLSKVLTDLNAGNTFTFEALKTQLVGDWEISNVYEFVSDLLEFAAVEKEAISQ
jgi:hypothetical protein